MSLLEVKNLNVSFHTRNGSVEALRDVSFSIAEGEALGLVGESGSGKSLSSLAIMGLLPKTAEITRGEILFKNRNLLKLTQSEKQNFRGKDIAMIFQDPMSSLNPAYTIEDQISESLVIHQAMTKHQAQDKVAELLAKVGITDVSQRMKAYPHELSGGLSQRVMIAMAMACNPKLLIADEPTTALDVTIQAQILNLLNQLRRENKMSLLLISHDLGLIAQNTDRLLIMYAGEIVEDGVTSDIMKSPAHPYTEALLKCLPNLDTEYTEDSRLFSISGTVANLFERPKGCQLQSRCLYKQASCESSAVPLKGQVRCLYPRVNS